MNAYDFNTDFMRFDPFAGRDPSNYDHEPEVRTCDCCGEVLALDETTNCRECIQHMIDTAPPEEQGQAA